MTDIQIHIDPEPLLRVLDEHGWTQDAWTTPDGRVCAHEAIRLGTPIAGDAHVIEEVTRGWGRGPAWNDAEGTTEADVRAWFSAGIDVTDTDLEQAFGPQWRAAVSLVRRAAVVTGADATRLTASSPSVWTATRTAAQTAARTAAHTVAWRATRIAGWRATNVATQAALRSAAWGAAWTAARTAAWTAARTVAWTAALAVVTWDLASTEGPYMYAHRDLLVAAWREVCGLPEGLLTEVST